MRLALYQPEIATNVGAAIRIAACFDAALDIVEPCGFPLKAREIKKVSMDYGAIVEPTYHSSWSTYLTSEQKQGRRLILLTTKATTSVHDFDFQANDILLIGQESAGVPNAVRDICDEAVLIPLSKTARSLNMSVAGAICLSIARGQVGY